MIINIDRNKKRKEKVTACQKLFPSIQSHENDITVIRSHKFKSFLFKGINWYNLLYLRY